MLQMNLQFFAHKKGVGSTKNGRDSESKRLGAKRADGQRQHYGGIHHRGIRRRGTGPATNCCLPKQGIFVMFCVNKKGTEEFRMDQIGKHIKKYREEKGLTQEQLAEQMSVTRQAVSNWENAKTQPDIDTLFRLSQIFEISIEELIYGEKRETAPEVINITKKIVHNVDVEKGLGFGSALAIVISYVKWKSIGWAVVHGLMSWIYVIYFALRY